MEKDMNKYYKNPGYLVFEVYEQCEYDYVDNWLNKIWDDGYIAFSKGEKRYSDFASNKIRIPLKNRITPTDNLDGYFMEADLWRFKKDQCYEELVIEREDSGFFCQRWCLYLQENSVPKNKIYYKCYYREINPYAIHRDKTLFTDTDLSAIEVVVSELRVHIFITKKRGII